MKCGGKTIVVVAVAENFLDLKIYMVSQHYYLNI